MVEFFQNLHWASTEVIYIGGYSLVILVSLLTVTLAKRAARMQDLEEARAELQNEGPGPDGSQPDRRLSVREPSPYPCESNLPDHANDAGPDRRDLRAYQTEDAAA